MSKIQGELDNGQFNMAICHVAPVHSQLTALAFLSYYLQDRDRKGLFISTSRPHYYIQRLLLRERLPVDKLVMIDAINRFGDGADADVLKPRSASMDDASHLVLQDQVLEKVYHALDDPNIEFLVVDNIAGLFPYLTEEKAIQLLRDIIDLVRVRSDFQMIILVDHDIGTEPMEKVTTLCDKQFEISPDLFK